MDSLFRLPEPAISLRMAEQKSMEKSATAPEPIVIEVKDPAGIAAAARSDARVKPFLGLLPEKNMVREAEQRFATNGPGDYALVLAIHRPQKKADRVKLARSFGHPRSRTNMWKIEPYRRNGYQKWAHCLVVMPFRYAR
jgi:hypothetical protein